MEPLRRLAEHIPEHHGGELGLDQVEDPPPAASGWSRTSPSPRTGRSTPPRRISSSSSWPAPRNFETFTTKLETPVANSRPRSSSSQLTETSRRLGKAGTHNQSEALHTDFFSHGLEPTCSRRLHSLTSCRLSLLLSVKLEAFSTA